MNKILLIFLVFLLSCDNRELRYGNVADKEYRPEHTDLILIPMFIPTGKTSTMIMIPYVFKHNESWAIHVSGVSTGGDSMTKTFYIDKKAYDTSKVGDFICVEGLCDQDTAVHKTKQKE